MKRKIIFIVSLLFVIMAIIIYQFMLKDYLHLAYLKQVSLQLKGYIHTHYAYITFFYLILYSFLIATAMPGVALLTLLGGFLFGTLLGTLYSVIGAIIGSLAFFFVVRYLLEGMMESKYGKKFAPLRDNVQKYGASYLLTLQFLTLVPYFVINTVAALAHVPLKTFIWTTAVGAIPLLFVYAFTGRQLSSIHSIRDIMSMQMLIAFGLLALLALLPIVIRKFKKIKIEEDE